MTRAVMFNPVTPAPDPHSPPAQLYLEERCLV